MLSSRNISHEAILPCEKEAEANLGKPATSPVEKILTKNGRVAGVRVNGQEIECEYVVLATGMWSRQIGEEIGVSIPLYPAEHFYVITEPIEELPKTLPVIRADR